MRQHHYGEINWDEQYCKKLLEKEYILSFLTHIQNVPKNDGRIIFSTRDGYLFRLAEWRRLNFEYCKDLDLELDNKKSIEQNIDETLWQLYLSYRRIKKLEEEYYDFEIIEEIKNITQKRKESRT